MPSVYVTWRGPSPDAAARDAVIARVAEVAALSDSLMDRHTVVRYDQAATQVLAQEQLFAPGAGRIVELELTRLAEVTLRGLEFRLSDPRNLYPGADRVSFVFASTGADDPGALVMVEDAAECALYRSDLIKGESLYLATPSIHLRYFAEQWLETLLAFLRRFHLPQLYYWRYDDLPGANRFDHVAVADEAGREAVWRQILASLFDELAEWIPKGEELGAIRDHLRQTGRMPARWFAEGHEPFELTVSIAEDTSAEERNELVRRLLFATSDFEDAARRAIYASGKGLDLRYAPVEFDGIRFAVSSRLDAAGTGLELKVRLARPNDPDHAVAANEAGPDIG